MSDNDCSTSSLSQGGCDMRRSIAFAALTVFSFAIMPTVAPAQTFEKKNYNYSEWTKGRFSEAVTVTGPGKMIFLAGVGSEDENGKGGDILHKGDFTAQSNIRSTRSNARSKRTGQGLATSSRWLRI